MSDETRREAIEQSALEPAEAHGDGRGMKAHSLRDQIAADKHLRSTAAAGSSRLPIRIAKIRPPGAV